MPSRVDGAPRSRRASPDVSGRGAPPRRPAVAPALHPRRRQNPRCRCSAGLLARSHCTLLKDRKYACSDPCCLQAVSLVCRLPWFGTSGGFSHRRPGAGTDALARATSIDRDEAVEGARRGGMFSVLWPKPTIETGTATHMAPSARQSAKKKGSTHRRVLPSGQHSSSSDTVITTAIATPLSPSSWDLQHGIKAARTAAQELS